jgi:hypothetical protein
MKRLMIIVLLTTICSTSMAGITSKSLYSWYDESWYDDFLALMNLQREQEEPLEEINIDNDSPDLSYTEPSQSPTTSAYSEFDPQSLDLSLPSTVGISQDIYSPDVQGIDSSNSSVITNPEPCSIILSSLGLGVVGYLKRRRAI